MDIYIVQQNDNIYSIANKFGVSATKLIQDNELEYPNQLVPGQTIVIVYPEQTYTVQDGDTLISIAEAFNVSIMQLLRNNPFLSSRDVYPGEVLTISYNTTGKLTTNGFIYSFINKETLKKTLPYLTYITIYNYKTISSGEIMTYFDDSEIIQLSKEYGTIPLMMVTTLSLQGEPDIDTANSILTNDEYQEDHINSIINTIKSKGYLGINLVFDYLTISTLIQHQNFVTNISNRFRSEGYLFFLTINANMKYVNRRLTFEEIDYSIFSQLVNNITFIQFIWGTNYGPPEPVSSIDKIRIFSNYIITKAPPENVTIGYSLISYDWKLPYIPRISYANSLSINSALSIAREVGSTIQFDDVSQSPFFTYELFNYGKTEQHIVWSIDARSILALIDLISQTGFNGTSLWNLMIYFPQLWLVINSQLEIEKLLPENLNPMMLTKSS